MWNRHHDRATDQLGKGSEDAIGDASAPILADEMHRPTAAQRLNQPRDIVREGASVEKATLWDLGRWIASQIRRHGVVASCCERRHLMAPRVGGVRKAVQ